MGTTGLLTILAILISGYGLLPDEKRLDIRLRISWLDLLIVSIPVVATIIVIYSPVILSTGYIVGVDWFWGFTEDTMVFSCLLFIILFFGSKLIGSRLPSANYARWDRDSEQYLRSKKFEQLGYLLNKYHGQLFEVINHQVWYVRLHNYLMPKPVLLITGSGEKTPFCGTIILGLRKFLAKLFPSHCKKQDKVKLSISRLLKSRAFVEYLAEAYPMIAAKSSCLRLTDRDEFVAIFFRALMSHTDSLLYRELRDNQNGSYTGEYFLDESNQLLNFYFKDISVAQEVGVWNPIRDYVIEYIKKQRGKDNFYNQRNDLFSDGEERWRCPIFAGSFFFDLMVSFAIFQRAEDHMDLMCTAKFLEEILASLNHADDVDKGREFPSKFDYLMYNIFSACDAWVGATEHLGYEGKAKINNISHFPEYWAAKTFGDMLRKIILSDKLPDSQKKYFLEIVVRRMRDLDQKELRQFSKLIIENCVKKHEFAAIDPEVIREIDRLYRLVDHVLSQTQSTFETQMQKYLAACNQPC